MPRLYGAGSAKLPLREHALDAITLYKTGATILAIIDGKIFHHDRITKDLINTAAHGIQRHDSNTPKLSYYTIDLHGI